jgi:hypothetical protein
MDLFKDRFEHSVDPVLDYPFATEIYSVHDSRYKVVEAYKSMFVEKVGVSPFNCKISIIKSADRFFNVNVYFQDIREIFSRDEIMEMMVDPKQKQPYNTMFMEALKNHPVPELDGKALNYNGVFFQDFRRCARSKSLSDAEPLLKKQWKKCKPQILFTMRRDDVLYLFLDTTDGIEIFCRDDHIHSFKMNVLKILKPYDRDHVWEIDSLNFILDVYEDFKKVGGQYYFNSNAMSGKKVI